MKTTLKLILFITFVLSSILTAVYTFKGDNENADTAKFEWLISLGFLTISLKDNE